MAQTQTKLDWIAGDDMPEGVGTFTDRFGNAVYFGNGGSFRLPAFPIGKHTNYVRHVRAIRDMEIFDDDIFICSFPKAGIHWNTEIISRLMNKTDQMIVSDFTRLERMPLERIQDMKRPRLIGTHAPFHCLPRQALKKKIKIVHLVRNPKDVLVSYYHMLQGMKLPFSYTGTFDQFVKLYLEVGHYYGDPLEHTRGYQEGLDAHPDVLVHTVMYEDMIKDPVGGVMKLNDFLGTGCNPDLCERIAHACSMKVLKAAKHMARDGLFVQERSWFAKEESGFYRKGVIGDWKNWFSPELNEEFDKEAEERLNGCTINFIYE